MKKYFALFIAFALFASLLNGCKTQPANIKTGSVEGVYPWVANKLNDTSDIPDWDGDEWKVRAWVQNAANFKNQKNDVVTPEILRVTGISFDDSDVMDNAGQTFEARLGMVVAGRDYPNIVFGGNVNKLAETGLIYDLTEYLPKYAPTIMEKFPAETFKHQSVSGGTDKIYAIPYGIGDYYFLDLEDFESERLGKLKYDTRGFVWVRDDILKTLYPNAKTQDEIEALYMEKGGFDEDDILDVSFKSHDEFLNFLRAVDDLKLTENGKRVYATYGFSGVDNWNLMQTLWSWLEGRGYMNNMFTYWDRASQKVELGLTQNFFKESLVKWNRLILDGVIPKDSLVDHEDVFKEKFNNGQYAVAYAQRPNEESLKKAGKTYRYRKVYIDIPINEDRFLPLQTKNYNMGTIAVFKDTVSEEQLIQLLRWADYMISDVGSKCLSWGPASSGLWTVKDGARVFTNTNVEEYKAYGIPNEEGASYFPSGNPMMISFGEQNYSKTSPAYMYDRKLQEKDATGYFYCANIRPLNYRVSILPHIYDMAKEEETAKKAWDSRSSVEQALTKILAAPENGFEESYNNLISVLKVYKWDDNMLKSVDKFFRDKNSKFMENLK